MLHAVSLVPATGYHEPRPKTVAVSPVADVTSPAFRKFRDYPG